MALKTELSQRWPMTGLLEIFKETELRVNFTEACRHDTPCAGLSPEVSPATSSMSFEADGCYPKTSSAKNWHLRKQVGAITRSETPTRTFILISILLVFN